MAKSQLFVRFHPYMATVRSGPEIALNTCNMLFENTQRTSQRIHDIHYIQCNHTSDWLIRSK